MQMRRCSAVLFLSCLVVFLASCSGAAGPRVKGQVLLDGKAVEGARVVFHGDGGNVTVTDAEGKFSLDGTTFKSVKPGKYIVRITKYVDKKTGQAIDPEQYDQVLAAGTAKNFLPDKYGGDEMNPLSGEIKAGENALPPFELKSK